MNCPYDDRTETETPQPMNGVPKGYKQTEVGVIPEEWDATSLGEFWTVTDCKHVTARFVSDGFPVASIRQVQGRYVDLAETNYTTAHYYSLLIEGARKPLPGDLIMSRNATVGAIAQVAEWHPQFAMGQDVCLLRKRNPALSSDYLQAVFQSHIIGQQLTNLMVGSTFKRANVEQIRNFSVPMPPPIEQTGIAAALSDVDALLAKLDQLIAKKRDLKQAAMQELLTARRRLPGFQGEWRETRLGELLDISSGKSKATFLRPDGDYLVCDMGAVSVDGKLIPSKRTDHLEGLLKRGDLVMPKDDIGGGRIIGKVAVIDKNAKYVLGDHVYRLRSKVDDSTFLSYMINSYGINSALRKKVAGSAQLGLSRKSVEVQELKIPSLPEQSSIATILSDMDAEIEALEARRDKTKSVKQGMMQELLTGRIRLV